MKSTKRKIQNLSDSENFPNVDTFNFISISEMSSYKVTSGSPKSQMDRERELQLRAEPLTTQTCPLEHTSDIVGQLKLPLINLCPNHENQECLFIPEVQLIYVQLNQSAN